MDRIIMNRMQLKEKPITRAIAFETLRHIKEDIPEPRKPIELVCMNGEFEIDKHLKLLDRIIGQYK